MFSKIKRFGTTACQLQISIDLRELTILEARDDVSFVCIEFERKTKSVSSSSQECSAERSANSPTVVVFDETLILLTTLYRDSTGKFLEKSGNLVLKGYSVTTSQSVKLGFVSLKLNALAADYAPQRLNLQFMDGKGKPIGSIKSSVTAKYLREASGDDDSSVISGASVRSMASVRSIASVRSNMSLKASDKVLVHGLVYKEAPSKFYSESPMSPMKEEKSKRTASTLPSLIFDQGDVEDSQSDTMSKSSGRDRLDSNADRCSVSSRGYSRGADVLELQRKVEKLQAEVDELNGLLYLSEKNLVDSKERSNASQATAQIAASEVLAFQQAAKESGALIASLSREKAELMGDLKKGREREAIAGEITRGLRRDIEIAQSESAAVQVAVMSIELQKMHLAVERLREQAAVSLTEKSLLISELDATRCQLTEAEDLTKNQIASKEEEALEKERALEQLSKAQDEASSLNNIIYDLHKERIKAEQSAEDCKKAAEASSLHLEEITAKLGAEIAGLLSELSESREESEHLKVEASKSVVLRGILTRQVEDTEAKLALSSVALAKQQSLVHEYSQRLQDRENSFLEQERSFNELQTSRDLLEHQTASLTQQITDLKDDHAKERHEMLTKTELLAADLKNMDEKGSEREVVLTAEIERMKTDSIKYCEELRSKVSECDRLGATLSGKVKNLEILQVEKEDLASVVCNSQAETARVKGEKERLERYLAKLYLQAHELKVCRAEVDRGSGEGVYQPHEVRIMGDKRMSGVGMTEEVSGSTGQADKETGMDRDRLWVETERGMRIEKGRATSGDSSVGEDVSTIELDTCTSDESELLPLDSQLELISQQMIASKARENVFSASIGSLKTQTSLQRDEIAQKDMENEGLRSELARQVAEIEEEAEASDVRLSEQIAVTDKALSELCTERDLGAERAGEIANLVSKVESLRAEGVEAASVAAARVEVLNTELLSEREEAAGLMTEIASLQSQIETMSAESAATAVAAVATVATLDDDLRSEREKVAALSMSCEERLMEIASLQAQVVSLHAASTETAAVAATTIAGLEHDLLVEREKVASMSMSGDERMTEISELVSRLGSLRAESTDAAVVAATIVTNLEHDLSVETERMAGLSTSVEERMTEISSLQTEIEGLKVERTVTGAITAAKVAELEQVLRTEREKVASMSMTGDERTTEMAALQSVIASLRAEGVEAAAVSAARVEDLNTELLSEREEAAGLLTEVAGLHSQVEGLKADSIVAAAASEAELQASRGQLDAAIEGYQAEVTVLRGEATSLCNEVSCLKEEMTWLLATGERLESELRDSKENTSELERRLSSLSLERAVLDERLSGLSGERVELEGRMSGLSDERIALLRVIEESKSNLVHSAKTDSEKEMITSESFRRQENAQSELEKRYQQTLVELEKMAAEKAGLEIEVEQLKEEIISNNNDIEEDINAYMSEIEELRHDVEQLKVCKAAVESKQFTLVESYEEEINKILEGEKQSIANSIRVEKERYLHEIMELKGEIETLKESHIWLETDYAEIKLECHLLEEKVEELEEYAVEEKTRCENQVIVLLKAVGLYDSSLDFRDNYWVEIFRLQLDEERVKILALKNCLVKFSEKLSQEDNEILLEAGIILAPDVTGHEISPRSPINNN